jgi:hypothetical protein
MSSIKCNCLWATKAKIFEAAARPRQFTSTTPGLSPLEPIDSVVDTETDFYSEGRGFDSHRAHQQNQILTLPARINRVTRRVVGMVLHPVAVTFARVTYLPPIGRGRLTHPNRPVRAATVEKGVKCSV